MKLRIHYNSPVILTFSLVSLAVLGLGFLTGDASTRLLFSVYRAPLTDPFTYLRFFGHVLGHSGLDHYLGNIMLFLVVGPPMEEKYGSGSIAFCIAVTALVSGLVQFIFFPGTALLGASGIVFMLIVLSSLSGMKGDGIPLTMIFVVILYLGGELVTALTVQDSVSQLTHIIGGLCGALLGFAMSRSRS